MTELLRQSEWSLIAPLAVGVAFAALLARVLLRAVLFRLAHGHAVVLCALKATGHAGAAAFPALALLLVWQAAPADLPFLMFVRHLTALLLIGSVTWFAMASIGGFAQGVIENNPVHGEDNLEARRIQTQTNVLSRSAQVVVAIAGVALALMSFPAARQVGASLLASAGVLGIVGGLAARPVFSNLVAGLQLALAQPIRLDDVLIVKGEWGKVEEITGTYVVMKIWDERRMIIPLQWFIENPFENWTRTTSEILGSVFLYLDFATPLEPIRAEARRIVEGSPDWDRRVFVVQVSDATERAMQVRVLVSARNAGKAWDLRCAVREGLLAFLAREYPASLPRIRLDEGASSPAPSPSGRGSWGEGTQGAN
jgi:small-conductance mechanosensitive channel